MLGNEVVSEADAEATGRKLKTFVRAAGATLAWQTSYFNTTNQTETGYVNFEHLDASAMSYRSTLSDGTPITNEGGEGSPAELDPLGGNVGLYTPYIQLTVPPFEPEYPSLQPMNEDMPMIVNGQRVTCSLDGMAIGCTQAQSMLNSGSAVPYEIGQYQALQQRFPWMPDLRFEPVGLGIFRITISGLNAFSDPPRGPDSVTGYWFAPAYGSQQQDDKQYVDDDYLRGRGVFLELLPLSHKSHTIIIGLGVSSFKVSRNLTF